MNVHRLDPKPPAQARHHIFHMVLAGLIAALYMTLTLLVAPLSYGILQLRLSEILTILPALTPAGIPGLALGCFLANLLNPHSLGPIDVIFGTLATTVAAMLTRWIALRLRLDERSVLNLPRQQFVRRPQIGLLTLPSILVNAIVVGSYLMLLLEPAQQWGPRLWLVSMGSVGMGQVLAAGVGAIVLYVALAPLMGRIYSRHTIGPRKEQL